MMKLLPTALLTVTLMTPLHSQATDLPAWRGASPATRFLGPDRYWRCRDTLIFALHDPHGKGFSLDVDVRDMNVYLQGPRPVLLWVTDPNGRTVARQLLDDDGILAGNQQFHDGIPDMYGDIRYRAWHRHNSPGGYPAGKVRSPMLTHPGELPARTVSMAVPPAGPGLYRLMVVGTWDNWVSVTPSRPLPAAISPGPAPLYLHKEQLQDSWIYTPPNTQDIGFSISEEVQPWSWSMQIRDATGVSVGEAAPKGPFNFALVRKAAPDSLYNLRFTVGSPGACLHARGLPLLICPDAATAQLFRGTMEIDDRQRVTWHQHQRVLNGWVDGLRPADLAVDVELSTPDVAIPGRERLKLKDVPLLLDAQNLDPKDDLYGDFEKTGDAALDKKINSFWNPAARMLAEVAGWGAPENPYYGHPGIVRRIMLYLVTKRFSTQSAYFWYNSGDGPHTFPDELEALWDLPFRSNWYPLQDAHFTVIVGPIRSALGYALPADVNEAWQQSVRGWGIGRMVMQQGECTNQWAKGLEHLANIWRATRDYEIEQVMRVQIDRFTTPGVLGRVNPDPDPWCENSTVGFGRAADSGIIGGGIPAEALGHDGEYALETVSHLSYIHSVLPNPKILNWLNEYYRLKTHLTLPKSGDWPPNPFTGTCSPTDTNHRTRYYTHKSGLHGAEKDVVYGDIWAGERSLETPWPALEDGSFVRSIDNRYHFLKTDRYYTVLYTGPAAPFYPHWGQAVVGDGTVDWLGYGGMHYGGVGYKATKLGAISAIWVAGCGPVWLCQNHNVMYTNGVWGHLDKPICERWEEGHVDPTVAAEGMNQPRASFDAKARMLDRDTSFHYLPLDVKRHVAFDDTAITIAVDITATDAMHVAGLYECIPVYVQDRTVTLLDNEFNPVPYTLPEPVTTTSKPSAPQPEALRGEMPGAPRVTARVIDVCGKSGAGAAIVFETAHTFTQTQPIRYRSVAAATGGFNLVLPVSWKRGQTVNLRYRVIPHETAITSAELREFVTEE